MTPELSFVVLTDTHVDVRPGRSDGDWWNRMLTTQSEPILRAAVERINDLSPDFVVHCGDLTNGSDEASFRAAAQILKHLKMPFHFVPGNHDTYLPGARNVAADLFSLPDRPFLHHVQRSGNWRLIFIDSSWWLWKDGSVREHIAWDNFIDVETPEGELDWVRRLFEEDPETPTFCFAHPVLAFREAYPVSRAPGGEPVPVTPTPLADQFSAWQALRAIIERQSCVKAAFFGHGHWHDCLIEDGTLYCQTAAMVEYPCELRLVLVYPNRIQTQVLGLSGTDFAKRSYVEEWGNTWVAGRPEDRHYAHAW
ncbi:MAG: metallophosphoesterase [Planctomycetota bacterium]